MEKVLEKGPGFVDSEAARLDRVLQVKNMT
jgi:hypothetical protein